MRPNPVPFAQVVKHVARDIRLGRVVFFCGAGISRDSGLPIVRDLLRAVLRTLPLTAADRVSILNSTLPFEAILESLRESTGSLRRLLSIFSLGQPGRCHRILAQLSATDLIPMILTTNFDVLLERALTRYQRIEGRHFRVFSNERSLRGFRIARLPSIVHIHGSVRDSNSLAATLQNVAAHTLLRGRRDVLTEAFSHGRTVVILGYSWSDVFDVSPMVAMLGRRVSSRILLIEHQSIGVPAVESTATLPSEHPLRHYRGHVVKGNTRVFLEALSDDILGKTQVGGRGQRTQASWRSRVKEWGRSTPLGYRQLAAANLLRHAGAVAPTAKYIERALRESARLRETRLHLRTLGAKGHLARATAAYDVAVECFSAIALKAGQSNKHGLRSQALKDLATICRETNDLERARECCADAIVAAKQSRDWSHIAHALACRAGLLSVEEDKFAQAAAGHLAAARAFGRLGEVRSQAAALTNAGEALLKIERFDEALEHLRVAAQLTHDCGDSRVAVAVCYELGRFARNVKAVAEGRALFLRTKRHAKSRRQRAYVVVALGNLAGLAAETRQTSLSGRYLRQAVAVAAESKNLVSLARKTAIPTAVRDTRERVAARKAIRQLVQSNPIWLRF